MAAFTLLEFGPTPGTALVISGSWCYICKLEINKFSICPTNKNTTQRNSEKSFTVSFKKPKWHQILNFNCSGVCCELIGSFLRVDASQLFHVASKLFMKTSATRSSAETATWRIPDSLAPACLRQRRRRRRRRRRVPRGNPDDHSSFVSEFYFGDLRWKGQSFVLTAQTRSNHISNDRKWNWHRKPIQWTLENCRTLFYKRNVFSSATDCPILVSCSDFVLFFCITSLPLASTRWVRLTLSNVHCSTKQRRQ